jgi:hypothetical protein
MKHLLLVALASVALAGCVTANGSTAAVTVSAVQEKTLIACNYLPLANTVVAISGQGTNANVQTAQEIAALICAAVQNRKPTVMGVPLQGKRV